MVRFEQGVSPALLEQGPVDLTWNDYIRTVRHSHPDVPDYTLDLKTGLYDKEQVWIENLRNLCSTYMDQRDLQRVEKSMFLAIAAHSTQYRDSGEPYARHVFAVATELVQRYEVDAVTVASALLHDTVEDVPWIHASYIKKHIGGEVAETVKGLTKFKGKKVRKELAKEYTRVKTIRSLTKNPRIALIKIYDRLDNVRTLGGKTGGSTSIYMTSVETEDIYVPLARVMGLREESEELEYWCGHYGGKNGKQGIEHYAKQWKEAIDTHSPDVLARDIQTQLSDTHCTVSVWPTSIASYHRGGYFHYNADIALSGYTRNLPEEWAKVAEHTVSTLNWSRVVELSKEFSGHMFRQEIQAGLTDALECWLKRSSDGMMIHVHIYPEDSYRLEKISIADLYYHVGPYTRTQDVKVLEKRERGRAKHQYLIDRIDDLYARFEGIPSSQILRELQPRLSRDSIRIVSLEGEEQYPITLQRGATVMDYARAISSPESDDWAKVDDVFINGAPATLFTELTAGSKVQVVWGDIVRWDPRYIYAFKTDRDGKARAKQMIGDLLIRYKKADPLLYRLLYQQVLLTGKWRLEQELPPEDRPLQARLSHARHLFEAYGLGAQNDESFYFQLGMGDVSDDIIQHIGVALREANRDVLVLETTFSSNRGGLLHVVAQAAATAGANLVDVASETIGEAPPMVTVYFDPLDEEAALRVKTMLSHEEVIQEYGVAYINLRRRGTPRGVAEKTIGFSSSGVLFHAP